MGAETGAVNYRNIHLDVLRAVAISMVVAYHLVQMWPDSSLLWLARYTKFGMYGVDFFFVISGWLIGGLFWRELLASGKLDLLRFWARRALRTIPPYFVALLVSWGAVAYFRAEPFDAGYLFFVQNYYNEMPYFLISWSLCIEEHFYLLMPTVIIAAKFFVRRILFFLVALTLLPALLRFFVSDAFEPGFGYYSTATHLNYDGLLLGVLAAYVWHHHKEGWATFALCVYSLSFSVLTLMFLSSVYPIFYVFERLGIALGFLAVLVFLVSKQFLYPRILASSFSLVARASYSLYLTHALALHVGLTFVYPTVGEHGVAFFVLQLLLVAGSGALFYSFVEKVALRWRASLFPSVRYPVESVARTMV